MSWMRNKTVAAVMLVLAVAAIVFLVYSMQPKTSKVLVVCKNTKEHKEMDVTADVKFPIKEGKHEWYPCEVGYCPKYNKTLYMIQGQAKWTYKGAEVLPGTKTEPPKKKKKK